MSVIYPNVLSRFLRMAVIVLLCFLVCSRSLNAQYAPKIQVVLDNTKPLEFVRGDRLPLFLWAAQDPGLLSDDAAETLVVELDKRGVALLASWKTKNRDSALVEALVIARAQKKLGLPVCINSVDPLYSLFNGDEQTAHIDEHGNPFWDGSFGRKHDMGCPFALNFRLPEIRERMEFYLDAYIKAGLTVDFIYADWEVDGPLEVNEAYEHSKRCVRCRKYLGGDFSFQAFQKQMREMRAYIQYTIYTLPVLQRFPDALVGNYAVYPSDGYRYWYDYFEVYNQTHPSVADQSAIYREWYDEFPLTGYMFAMPVSYPWSRIYGWYDYANTDYRWFYNMLLVASNAAKSTPQGIPVISFVHWHTVFYPQAFSPEVIQMSAEAYQELLWHMLLRGVDGLFTWSEENEFAEETRLLHEVYATAQEYGEFLDYGLPITFEVPKEEGAVVSGLILGERVLVRRTDFSKNFEPVTIMAGTSVIEISAKPGQCQIINVKK